MMPIRDESRPTKLGLVVLALLALALSAVTALAATGGEAADKGTWKNIQLIYSTDIKGKIDPCG